MDSAGSACLIPPAEVQCRQSEVRKTLPVPVGERHRQGLGSVSDHRTSHTPPRTTRKQCGQRAVKMKQNGEEIAKTAQNARKSFRGRFTRRRSLVRVQQSPPNPLKPCGFKGFLFRPYFLFVICLQHGRVSEELGPGKTGHTAKGFAFSDTPLPHPPSLLRIFMLQYPHTLRREAWPWTSW